MNPRRINLAVLALAAVSAVHSAVGAPSIFSVRLAGGPDTPHYYASTFNYSSLPASVSVSPGALVYFIVSASGSGAISYQWRFNGSDLPGETGTRYGYPGRELAAGDYTVVVTDSGGSLTSKVATLTIDPTFTKINAWNGDSGSTDAIVTDTGWSACGTWGDYNNDGYLDLFVGNGLDGHSDQSALYRNNGDGSFSRLFPAAFNTPIIQTEAAGWGDYDNDGNLDLFVLTTNSTPTGPNGGFLLYHNEGTGEFTQPPSGIMVTTANTFGATWVDYDQDGFLDLFVTTLNFAATGHCFLFRNQGDGTFAPMTDSILVTDSASSVGCAWGDYDNDGKTDLFVCGGRGSSGPQAQNRLYHNNGDGTFTRITTGSIATDAAHSGNCAWGDYDNDGYLDLLVVNILGEQSFLYHNNGNGTFTRITGPIVTNSVSGWFEIGNHPISCAWGDYDNDGFLDLITTDEGSSAPFVNFIYHNNGDGTFTRIFGSPGSEFSDSFGCSWVDYDNDGFLDLFAIRGDRRGNALYHNNWQNNGNTNAWLTVKLIGTVSNRSAIGAKVRVKAFYRGQNRWQLRQITGGSGWSGHDELRAHFGLGDATNVDTLRIEWPSGAVQEFRNVPPGQILSYTEPPRLLASATNGAPQFFLRGGRFMQYDIQASADLAAWSPAGTVMVTNLNGMVRLPDPGGPGADHRFYRAVSH